MSAYSSNLRRSSIVLSSIFGALCLFSSISNAEEQKSTYNPIRECYSSTRTMTNLMPREYFEQCIRVQKGPLSKNEFDVLTLSHKKGLISKNDLHRLKNHFKVTDEFYTLYTGTLRDYQLDEWRRRDTNGYFEAIYDQIELEVPKLFDKIGVDQNTPPREAVLRIVRYFAKSVEYNLKISIDNQIIGKLGDNPKVFVEKDKKLFTGYPQKGFYEVDEIFNVLIEKHGVCASFAVLLNNLLDRLKIKNGILLIYAVNGPGHAANVVELDGKEYIIDPTAENSKFLTAQEAGIKYKSDMLYTFDKYKKFLQEAVPMQVKKFEIAELEHGYARAEKYVMSLKEKRAQRQN